jgi:protein-disulfide isomerase
MPANPSKRNISARRKQKQRDQRKRTIVVLGILALIIAAFIFYPKPQAPEVSLTRAEDNPSLGVVGAQVVLTEFGDFTCSACRSWHQAGVVEQILEQYNGLVRVEWRDFPVITADSPKAAQAGQCAYDQLFFWEYLDRVYSEPGSSYTNAGIADLRRYAADIGLDVEAFNTCLDENQHQETVDFDLEAARELRLPGTPAFLVNGKPIIGANPELLIKAIDEALAANDS